jgi:hypothetical protein
VTTHGIILVRQQQVGNLDDTGQLGMQLINQFCGDEDNGMNIQNAEPFYLWIRDKVSLLSQ